MNKTLTAAAAVLLAAGVMAPDAGAQETVMQDPLAVTSCEPTLNVASYSPYTGWYAGGFWGPWYGPWYGGWYGGLYGAWPYAAPAAPTATLRVVYANLTQKPMRTIDFGLIANGFLVARVRDVGTFSPGVEIKHDLPLDSNVFPLQTALPICTPLQIAFVDGTSWSNPALQKMRRQLYEPLEAPTPQPAPAPSQR